MIHRLATISVILLSLTGGTANAGDIYVITGTYKAQAEAQEVAALRGGWVLNTNFYDRLTPNLFAVVRGPFATAVEAEKHQASLMRGGRYPGSYVKDAGAINIQIKIGDRDLSPQMLAALFGEISMEVVNEKGASNPCEPQEPYSYVSLSYVSIARGFDEKTDAMTFKPDRIPLNAGAFRQIERTGEIRRMRICAE